MKNAIRIASALFALIASSFAGVTMSSPANGSVSNSPIHVVAQSQTETSSPIIAIQIYVDGVLALTNQAASVDTYVNVSGGNHQIAVKAWDSSGRSYLAISNTAASGQGVIVASPSQSANLNGPVKVVASAASSSPIVAMRIYDNNNSVFVTTANNINTTLPLGNGGHYLVVQAWDAAGNIYKTPVTISVGGSAPAPAPVVQASQAATTQVAIPSGANTIPNIEKMGGWQSCDTCAGANGAGPTNPYSMSQGVGSPSMDGSSAVYWLGGSTRYGSAIWWKQLGANPNASHFVYDLYFYTSNPSISQALEFDVNQSVNNLKYIFGTECDIRTNGGWRVWDTANAHWVSTGVGCSVGANTWNHLTWEMERAGSQTHFIAVTLNGNRQVVDRYFQAKPVGASELNVAFQMDGDEHEDNYQVYLNKVSLTAY